MGAKLFNRLPKNKLAAGLTALGAAAVGIYVVVVIHAATASVSVETEAGMVAGLASQVVDSLASGGRAIKFGGSAVATTTYPKTALTSQINLISSGQWSYMPATTLASDGLRVDYRNFQIVEQSGTGGQPNPAVNEYGTHLEVPAGFVMGSKLTGISGAFSLQLYATPPKISDEFRVEPKSIRMTFNNGALTLARWDGNGGANLASQQPVATASGTYAAADPLQIAITDTGGNFSVTVNGGASTTLADGGTFSGGQAWIGANVDTTGGHFTIASLTAQAAGAGTVYAVDTSASPAILPIATGLQTLATKKRSDFLIGSDIAVWAMTSDLNYHQRMFDGDFGILTPENAGKMQFTEPVNGVFDFHELDAIVAEAKKNNMKIHGHVLTFGEAMPRWLTTMPTATAADKAAVQSVLTQYAMTIGSRYKGVIGEWDINEVFSDTATNTNMAAAYKSNIWYNAMGANYPIIAAKALSAADPGANIFVNEYGLEQDGGARFKAVESAISTWKAAGANIYGVGLQAHIYDPATDLIVSTSGTAAQLDANIASLAAMGLKTRISELDGPTGSYSGTSQGAQFAGVLSSCLKNVNCFTLSTWSNGPTDLYQEGTALQPVGDDSLFSADMTPTAGYTALQNALK